MNISHKLKNNYTKLAILVIIVGILIRFILVIPYHVAGDACWYLSAARFMAENFRIPLYEHLGRGQPFWSPPIFHIIAAMFYKIFSIFGSNAAEFGIKLVSPIFGSLSLIFTYKIFRKIFDEKISLYALIFITFLPMSIDYGVFSYADSVLMFFVVASIYFALINRIFLSGLFLALASLTKYTGLCAIPVILYVIYIKNKKLFLKKSIMALAITGVLASPWYIRNWIYLNNPVYPILNSVFGGIKMGAIYSGFDFSRLLSINTIIVPFLETFGVPDGNVSHFTFFNIPFLPLILILWLSGTLIFIIPIFFGFNIKRNKKNMALTWFGPYALAGILHTLNVGWSIARRILPAYPSLAFFWGKGLDNIAKKTKYKKIIFSLLTLIICGFVLTEFIKITLAANEWNFYEKDFEWVKLNTEENAIFMAGGQCLGYNLHRQVLYPSEENIVKSDYILVNQNFRVDKKAIISRDILNLIDKKNFKEVYQNKASDTVIYKAK